MPHRRNQLRLQRLFTFCHLIGFALFLGGTLGVTFLAVAGEYLSGGLHREFALSAGGRMPSDYGDLFGFFLRVGIIQVGVLLLLAGLGVFKPGGRARPSRSPSPGAGA